MENKAIKVVAMGSVNSLYNTMTVEVGLYGNITAPMAMHDVLGKLSAWGYAFNAQEAYNNFVAELGKISDSVKGKKYRSITTVIGNNCNLELFYR